MDAVKLNEVTQKQLKLAQELYTGVNGVARLKANYEALVNIMCTKHSTDDSLFYIVDCGSLGFQAIKFYNNSSDYRLGSYHETPSEAYSEAICYM